MAREVYELSFKGTASPALRAAFGHYEVVSGSGLTTVRGSFSDQGALETVLSHIHALGLELQGVRLVVEVDELDDPFGELGA